MDVSFTSIAFTLQYSSVNIDSVYAALDIMARGDQKIPAPILIAYREWLPLSLINWVEQNPDVVNIIFEERDYPNREPAGDWELVAL